MHSADTASLTAVAPNTSIQRTPTARPSVRVSASATSAMRTVCSVSWLNTLGATCRRAMKKPRSPAETAIHGIPSAETRKAPTARTSPSHNRAARSAVASCSAAANSPSTSPAAIRRRSMPRAAPWAEAGPLSSSAMSRVAATETPAVASVTNSEYTASTSW